MSNEEAKQPAEYDWGSYTQKNETYSDFAEENRREGWYD